MILNLKASAIAGVLFCSLYFACQMFYSNTLGSLTDSVIAIWAIFLLVGPMVTLVVGIIPTIVGGKILTIFLTEWLKISSSKRNIGIVFGIVLGGLFGYILAQTLEWGMHFSRFTRGPYCGLLSGTLAGAGAGAWYAWKTILAGVRSSN